MQMRGKNHHFGAVGVRADAPRAVQQAAADEACAPVDEGSVDEGVGGIWVDVHGDKALAENVGMAAAMGWM
jgi:hypothetical protein